MERKETFGLALLPLKVDLSKYGLDMCFKQYERIMLLKAWASPSSKFSSRELYDYVSEKIGKFNKTISRASVIFAADRFVEAGIWGEEDRTGKGGHHSLYFAANTEAEFWERVRVTSQTRLGIQ